jgi:hypothetical protein
VLGVGRVHAVPQPNHAGPCAERAKRETSVLVGGSAHFWAGLNYSGWPGV